MSGFRREVGPRGQDECLRRRAVLWVVLSPGPLQSLVQMCLDRKRDEKGRAPASRADTFREHMTESVLCLPPLTS